MPIGNKSKSASCYIKIIKDLIERHKIEMVYKLISALGGLKVIVEAEKEIYKKHKRSYPFSKSQRKSPNKDCEASIRKELENQQTLTIGSRDFQVFATEVSTKKHKSSTLPGGSIDLLAIDKSTKRVVILELKNKHNKERFISAIIQGCIYRAQLSFLKSNLKTLAPQNLLSKRNMRYGVIVLAVDGWNRINEEKKYLRELFKRNAAELYAVAKIQKKDGIWQGNWIAGGPKS